MNHAAFESERKLIALLPGTTLDELASYQDAKYDQLKSRRSRSK